MTEEQLLDRMKKTLRVAKLDGATQMESAPDWDSGAHLRLMLDLEKAFVVRIPTDQFATLTSVRAIVAYFRKSGKLAA